MKLLLRFYEHDVVEVISGRQAVEVPAHSAWRNCRGGAGRPASALRGEHS